MKIPIVYSIEYFQIHWITELSGHPYYYYWRTYGWQTSNMHPQPKMIFFTISSNPIFQCKTAIYILWLWTINFMPELDRSEFIGVSCSFELFVEKFSSGPPDISIVGGSLNYSFPVLTTKCHHWGSPEVNKFEQVSSHVHQMSLVGVESHDCSTEKVQIQSSGQVRSSSFQSVHSGRSRISPR